MYSFTFTKLLFTQLLFNRDSQGRGSFFKDIFTVFLGNPPQIWSTGVVMLGRNENIPARHTVVIPFGMDEHFFHHNGLFRSFLLVHVMLSKNHPVCVESGLEKSRSVLHF